MPKLASSTLTFMIVLLASPLQQALAEEAWQAGAQWNGSDKSLRSGLRVGEVVQHLEYKSFFTRHVVISCFEGINGYSIGLDWAEISIEKNLPVLFTIDGRKPELVPKSVYSDEHFVLLPAEEKQSIELVAGFIRGLEVAFWTKDRSNREYEHLYSLAGFTKALDEACGWHPSFQAAKEFARTIRY